MKLQLLQLTKADGTMPSAEEVAKLIADAKVAKADAAISKARKALHKEMEGKYAVLRLEGEVLASAAAPAALAAFNTALGELRGAVGATYKVTRAVKTAGAGGATSVRFELTKAVFADPNSDKYALEPVSVLDIAKCKEAKNVFLAEHAVADALARAGMAAKAPLLQMPLSSARMWALMQS